MNVLILSTQYAYARGYFDGRANRNRRNMFSIDEVEIEEHTFYERGFNDGVSDFHLIDKDAK